MMEQDENKVMETGNGLQEATFTTATASGDREDDSSNGDQHEHEDNTPDIVITPPVTDEQASHRNKTRDDGQDGVKVQQKAPEFLPLLPDSESCGQTTNQDTSDKKAPSSSCKVTDSESNKADISVKRCVPEGDSSLAHSDSDVTAEQDATELDHQIVDLRSKLTLDLKSNNSAIDEAAIAPELPDEIKTKPTQSGKHQVRKVTNFERWAIHRNEFLDIGPPPPNHMRINVSGALFDIPMKWVAKFPESIFCSPDMNELYRPELGVYFIDRNRTAFEYILQYMASDKTFHQFPDCLPPEMMEMELEYYRIGWRFVVGSLDAPSVGDYLDFRTPREKVFAFFNYPESSSAAKAYMYIDLVFILVSIFKFMMLTEPLVNELRETSATFNTSIRAVQWCCLIFFTADLIARAFASLDRLQFILDYTTWLDILSVIPFYADIFYLLPERAAKGYIQLLKMARISRCLKIIRRSETLLVIIDILVSCSAELGLLSIVWLLGVIISGTLLYFAENQIPITWKNDTRAAYQNTTVIYANGTMIVEPTEWFYSILESCWQAVVLIGTIGYGNVYPYNGIGKIIASGIIFLSSLLMAVPMTIIIKRFSEMYDQRAREKSVRKVFGGRFEKGDQHVVELEDRKVTTKQLHTARCIERYRHGQSMYQNIKRFLRSKLGK